MSKIQATILCILDGFGLGDAHYKYNAAYSAGIPNISSLLLQYPNCTLGASGADVGLPAGQMGNSEVGHMTIGAGRIIKQGLPIMDELFLTDKFKINNQIKQLEEYFKERKDAKLHILFLASEGGVHSHYRHTIATAKHFAGLGLRVVLHAISDGRDVPPESYIDCLDRHLLPPFTSDEMSRIEFATLSGRYYAMDRDKNHSRTAEAARAILGNCPNIAQNLDDTKRLVRNGYASAVGDEFIPPIITNGDYSGPNEQDILLSMNFRADRVRQIFSHLLKQEAFAKLVSVTHYSDEISSSENVEVIIRPQSIQNSISEVLSANGARQLKIAETEKYAHITFFFNGGQEDPFAGEDRVLIPSPKVKTYDILPEMSILNLTKTLFERIRSREYDFIVINIANPDMVGHTGNFEAAVQAMQYVDDFIGQLRKESLSNLYNLIITADHGNIEEMVDGSGKPHTQHTTGRVPFIYIPNQIHAQKNIILKQNGGLSNIAPTLLSVMGLPQPQEMTQRSLVG